MGGGLREGGVWALVRRPHLPPGCVASTSSLFSGPQFLHPYIERGSPFQVKSLKIPLSSWAVNLQTRAELAQNSTVGPSAHRNSGCTPKVSLSQWGRGLVPGASHCPCPYLITHRAVPEDASPHGPQADVPTQLPSGTVQSRRAVKVACGTYFLGRHHARLKTSWSSSFLASRQASEQTVPEREPSSIFFKKTQIRKLYNLSGISYPCLVT